MNRLVLLAALLLSAGCSSTGEMMEHIDRGIASQIAARKLERGGEPAQALAKFEAAAKDYERALKISQEDERRVFQSMMWMKLSTTYAGMARCLQPDNNPQGSWEAATERWKQSGTWALEGRFLRRKVIALLAEAYCLRPDKNPKGTWRSAAETYAKAAKLAKSFGDDPGRGEALRSQAFCLVEGDFKKPMSAEVRFMLVKARQLGDEEAADLLAKGRYCMSCGESLPGKSRFCPKCGKDQTVPVKKPKEFKLKRRLRPGEEAPSGMPGGPN